MNTEDFFKHFIGLPQLSVIRENTKGEEGVHFSEMLQALAVRITLMPKTYETDGQGEAAVVSLHYFKGGMDWYIVERDLEPERLQAFGYADIGYGPEAGYISIEELLENDVELDLYWTPRPWGEVKKAAAA